MTGKQFFWWDMILGALFTIGECWWLPIYWPSYSSKYYIIWFKITKWVYDEMSMLSLWSGSLWYRNPSQNERDWWPINHKFELKAELLWDSKSFMILVKTQISFSLGIDFAFQNLDKLSKLCLLEFKKSNQYNLHCTFTYKYLVILYLSVHIQKWYSHNWGVCWTCAFWKRKLMVCLVYFHGIPWLQSRIDSSYL